MSNQPTTTPETLSPAAAPAQLLVPAYTCGICRRIYTLPGGLIIGEKKEQRLARVGAMLARHLESAHLDHLKELLLVGQQITGWLFTETYAHNDAELAVEFNAARLALRQRSQRVFVSDEEIEQKALAVVQHPEFAGDPKKIIAELCRTLRDHLCEGPPPPKG